MPDIGNQLSVGRPPEILFILALILTNGLLAMSEFAVVSSRKARLRQWAEAGNTKARAALALAESPGHFLSAIQIGITLIGIFAGAYSGITIAEQLAAWLSRVVWLAAYSQSLALTIVVLAITFLTLVIGELVPRRIALHSPERIAVAVAAPMRVLAFVTTPFVHLLHFSTGTVLRAGAKPDGLAGFCGVEAVATLLPKEAVSTNATMDRDRQIARSSVSE